MALIKCPECGKEISERSGKCVHCGCPISQPQDINIEENILMICKPAIDAYGFAGVGIFCITCLLFVYDLSLKIVIPIWAICILWILSIHSRKLTLTTKGIYSQKGLILTTKNFTPLSAISSLTVEAGLFGKSAKYADIKIVSPENSYVFTYMKNAEEFNKKFMQLRGNLDWRTF